MSSRAASSIPREQVLDELQRLAVEVVVRDHDRARAVGLDALQTLADLVDLGLRVLPVVDLVTPRILLEPRRVAPVQPEVRDAARSAHAGHVAREAAAHARIVELEHADAELLQPRERRLGVPRAVPDLDKQVRVARERAREVPEI